MMNERQTLMVANNLPLIRLVIKKSRFIALDNSMDYDDLYQIGSVGLIKAAESYRSGKTSFASYAYCLIWREIAMDMRKKQTAMRNAMLDSVSLDQPVGFNAKFSLVETIPGASERPDAFLDDTPVADYVEDLRRRNPVLCGAFLRKMEQAEAGRKLGLSQSYVSRLVKKEKRKLSEMLRRNETIIPASEAAHTRRSIK